MYYPDIFSLRYFYCSHNKWGLITILVSLQKDNKGTILISNDYFAWKDWYDKKDYKKPGLQKGPRLSLSWWLIFCTVGDVNCKTIKRIDHFRVPLGFCFKTRVGAQPLIWKSFFFLMQIKLIFTRKVVHLASFWKWGFLELGSGQLPLSIESSSSSNTNKTKWYGTKIPVYTNLFDYTLSHFIHWSLSSFRQNEWYIHDVAAKQRLCPIIFIFCI